ncbi:hypothetical protein [Caulobacter segnis]
MVNPVDKYRQLSELLYEKTSAGHLKWEEDPLDNSFNTKIGPRLLEIDSSTDEDDNPIMIVRVYFDGKMIERFDDEKIKGTKPKTLIHNSYYVLLSDVYEIAKRNASGADEQLDDLLKDLQMK